MTLWPLLPPYTLVAITPIGTFLRAIIPIRLISRLIARPVFGGVGVVTKALLLQVRFIVRIFIVVIGFGANVRHGLV
jgi:hypothetical protein